MGRKAGSKEGTCVCSFGGRGRRLCQLGGGGVCPASARSFSSAHGAQPSPGVSRLRGFLPSVLSTSCLHSVSELQLLPRIPEVIQLRLTALSVIPKFTLTATVACGNPFSGNKSPRVARPSTAVAARNCNSPVCLHTFTNSFVGKQILEAERARVSTPAWTRPRERPELARRRADGAALQDPAHRAGARTAPGSRDRGPVVVFRAGPAPAAFPPPGASRGWRVGGAGGI